MLRPMLVILGTLDQLDSCFALLFSGDG